MAKKQFKAESKRLLDLMINSIYTHKEIFLREIISNASDAIDKLCYLSLTDDKAGLDRGDFKIEITVDKDARTLTVSDNGIGMDEEQLKKYIHAICVDGHVGISNVHRRLSLIYGENYKIHVVSAPGEGTSIKIWIPVEY